MNFNTWFITIQTRTVRNAGAGLVAFKALLDRLGNPERAYKIIHVAGTNGKGTVCTLLAHTLTCAGYKTGLFVSPHLISPTERIQIGGLPITDTDFKQIVETVLTQQQEPLNFFELMTAAALVYFAKQQVQYVVLETGLGGRKDPTSVCIPVLSIITSIGLDHMALLGNTLTQIAAEKAGIIKPQVPVLCGDIPVEVAFVFEQTAQENCAPLTWSKGENLFEECGHDFEYGYTILRSNEGPLWKLHLLGGKQTQNACIVWHAAHQLGITETALKIAFETVQLAGRFERSTIGNTPIILDGAHNLPAIQELMRFWQKTPYHQPDAVLLCAFMKDKDFKSMMGQLKNHFKQIILTTLPFERAATHLELNTFLNDKNIRFEPDWRHALRQAAHHSSILCTGSFYLVGTVRKLLLPGTESSFSS